MPVSENVSTRVKSDKNDVINKIIKENGKELKVFISCIVFNDAELSEDIYQETWIHLIKVYNRIDMNRPILPFLRGISRMTLLNHLRKERVRNKYHVPEDTELQASSKCLSGHSYDEYGVFFNELQDLCISGLSAREIQTYYDCFVNLLPHTEIARIRNITVENSKMRKSRLAAKLRKKTKHWIL